MPLTDLSPTSIKNTDIKVIIIIIAAAVASTESQICEKLMKCVCDRVSQLLRRLGISHL